MRDIKEITSQPKLNKEKFFRKFPIIRFGDFILRELMLADNIRYYQLLSDPNVSQYLSDEDIPSSPEAAIEEIKFWSSLFYLKHSIYWCIAEAKTNNLIGTIGFNSWSFYNNRAEISYELMSQYWRRGIMSATMSQVLDFAFTTMQIHRMEAKTMTHNIASQKFLEKHNFTHESLMKAYRKVRGKFVDIETYVLFKNDWLAQ